MTERVGDFEVRRRGDFEDRGNFVERGRGGFRGGRGRGGFDNFENRPPR